MAANFVAINKQTLLAVQEKRSYNKGENQSLFARENFVFLWCGICFHLVFTLPCVCVCVYVCVCVCVRERERERNHGMYERLLRLTCHAMSPTNSNNPSILPGQLWSCCKAAVQV